MTRLLVSAAVASSLALGGCASTPASDHAIASTATGAVIGAGAGALAGSVLPALYAGTGDRTNGYGVYKMRRSGSSYRFTPIVTSFTSVPGLVRV